LNTDSSNKFSKRLLYLVLITAFIIRILFVILISDTENLEFYEFGAITENLKAGNGYSLFYFQNDNIQYKFNPEVKPFVSAYVPPGYVLFLFPFYFIGDLFFRNLLIVFTQILISLFVIILLYKFTHSLFGEKTAIIAAFIYALLPEFVFAHTTINVVLFFHLGILVIFYLLHNLNQAESNIKQPLIIGLAFGFLILFRSEALLFLFIIVFYLLTKKLFKPSFLILFVALVTILPWQLRNIIAFDEFVPITTSFGVNFYRGHNPYAAGAWADEKVVEELKEYKDNPDFELNLNRILLNSGINHIKEHPISDFILSFEKIIHLWIFNYDQSRAYHPLYLYPWLLMLVFIITGMYKFFNWEKQKYIILFLIYFTLITFIFFSLPRYQTMMKIALIPFAAQGLIMISEKIYFRIKK
jgi:4-amino-4-deoxy-L-arabinose transferase-like glycosyltransferase